MEQTGAFGLWERSTIAALADGDDVQVGGFRRAFHAAPPALPNPDVRAHCEGPKRASGPDIRKSVVAAVDIHAVLGLEFPP
jgi:hypothetical protein